MTYCFNDVCYESGNGVMLVEDVYAKISVMITDRGISVAFGGLGKSRFRKEDYIPVRELCMLSEYKGDIDRVRKLLYEQFELSVKERGLFFEHLSKAGLSSFENVVGDMRLLELKRAFYWHLMRYEEGLQPSELLLVNLPVVAYAFVKVLPKPPEGLKGSGNAVWFEAREDGYAVRLLLFNGRDGSYYEALVPESTLVDTVLYAPPRQGEGERERYVRLTRLLWKRLKKFFVLRGFTEDGEGSGGEG